MRLKLVFAASSLAAVVGAGASISIVQAVFASLRPFSSPGLIVSGTLLLPLASIIFAGIFVYRHTARRRKLQAALTGIIATVLTLLILIAAAVISARKTPRELPLTPNAHGSA